LGDLPFGEDEPSRGGRFAANDFATIRGFAIQFYLQAGNPAVIQKDSPSMRHLFLQPDGSKAAGKIPADIRTIGEPAGNAMIGQDRDAVGTINGSIIL
jgi:hypothetical protein